MGYAAPVPSGARHAPASRRSASICAMLVPLLWLVRSSFMGLSQIFIFPPEWIPDPWRWDNYPEALTTIPFVRYFFNTLFILVPTVAGTLLTATLAAYGFSRRQWPGRDWVFRDPAVRPDAALRRYPDPPPSCCGPSSASSTPTGSAAPSSTSSSCASSS